MLRVSGEGEDSQWFKFKPAVMASTITVEWEKDTRSIIIPAAAGDALIRQGHARLMTSAEAHDYNARQGGRQEDPPQKEEVSPASGAPRPDLQKRGPGRPRKVREEEGENHDQGSVF
jgi:hypothetical protein